MDATSQRVLILGLAREGVCLARHFATLGADVTVTDSAPESRLQDRIRELEGLPVRLALGDHQPELVKDADLFFTSPGVPESNPVYRAAVASNLPVQSMTTLFFGACPGRIVGVTGSSGKTTTTGLIHHILRAAGMDVVVGGNIGDPMLDLLPSIQPGTIVVLELSSFQLGLLRRSPHVAVVTNITPNHLDRHHTMESYIAAKQHIVRHQSPDDWAVLNAGDPHARSFADATPGSIRWFRCGGDTEASAFVKEGNVVIRHDGRTDLVLPVSDIPLLGRHNVENVLAAVTATDILDAEPAAMAEAIRSFRPAPHRLQTVGEWGGVRYVDDSIATSPARAVVALQAIPAPILLIAGGRDKKLPWDEFAVHAVRRARAVFLIGEAAPDIERAIRSAINLTPGLLQEDAIHRCRSLQDAVTRASRIARPGEVVLLSPACTSYDMFSDFAERGDVFARTVEALDAA